MPGHLCHTLGKPRVVVEDAIKVRFVERQELSGGLGQDGCIPLDPP